MLNQGKSLAKSKCRNFNCLQNWLWTQVMILDCFEAITLQGLFQWRFEFFLQNPAFSHGFHGLAYLIVCKSSDLTNDASFWKYVGSYIFFVETLCFILPFRFLFFVPSCYRGWHVLCVSILRHEVNVFVVFLRVVVMTVGGATCW